MLFCPIFGLNNSEAEKRNIISDENFQNTYLYQCGFNFCSEMSQFRRNF